MLAAVREGKRVKTASQLKNVIKKLINSMENEEKVDLEEYRYVCEFIFGEFAVDWLSCLSHSEAEELYKNFIHSLKIPAGEVIRVLILALKSDYSKTSASLKVIVEQIERFVDRRGLVRIFEELIQKHVSFRELKDQISENSMRTLRQCVSLPVLIANRLGRKVGKRLSQKSLHELILEECWKASIAKLSDAEGNASLDTDKYLRACICLNASLQALLALGGAKEYVGDFIVRKALEDVKIDKKANNRSRSLDLFGAILASIPRTEAVEPLLIAILSSLVDSLEKKQQQIWFLMRLMRASQSSAIWQTVLHLLTQKFILAKQIPTKVRDVYLLLLRSLPRKVKSASIHILALINESPMESPKYFDQSLASTVLLVAAEAWGSAKFLRNLDPAHQRYLTSFVLTCVKALGEEGGSNATHSCIQHLMRGIHARLDSLVPEAREEGMRVAELFSVLLDPSNPLNFDETPKISTKEQPQTSTKSSLFEKADQKESKLRLPKWGFSSIPFPFLSQAPVAKILEKKATSGEITDEDDPESAFLRKLQANKMKHVVNGESKQLTDGTKDSDMDENADIDDPDAMWVSPKPAKTVTEDAVESDPYAPKVRIKGFFIEGETNDENGFQKIAEEKTAWGSLWDEDEDEDENLNEIDELKETLDDDTSDLKDVKKPTMLIQCLEYIRNTKSQNHMESGVEALENCLNNTPQSTLRPMANTITKAILHLWSVEAFDSKKYELLAFKSSALLLSLCPEESIKQLHSTVFDANHSLPQRCVALEIIEAGAYKLANTEETKLSQKIVKMSKSQKRVETSEMKRWEIIRERVESRETTRRWGKKRVVEPTTVNRFAKISRVFFAPLLAFAMRPISLAKYEDADAPHWRILYSGILRTLGTLVECSGRSAPDTLLLVRSLFELIYVTRFHKLKEIRRQTLVAAGKALRAIPPALLTELRVDLREIVDWLKESFKNDPDDDCKELSRAILSLILRMQKETRRIGISM